MHVSPIPLTIAFAARRIAATAMMSEMFFASVLLLVAVGCGSHAECVPGASVSCVCPGGAAGAQQCLPDRTFDTCSCAADAGVQHDSPPAVVHDASPRQDALPDAMVDSALPDAPPPANIPDVSGTFLISIRISFAPARALEILATTVLTKKTDGTAAFDLDGRFLAVADRKPTGDPVVIHGTVVNNAGELMIVKDNLFIPKAANPLVRDATVENAKLPGAIKSADLICGVVRGHVAEGNVDLEQSEPDNPTTFAAVRVTDADHLPAVNMTVACP